MPHFPFRIQLYVRATDADLGVNARVSYRIFRPPHPLEFQSGFDRSMTPFEVDPQSGQLIISRALDDEIGGESQVLVEACDSSATTGVSTQLCSSPARIVIRLAKRAPDVVPQIACTSSSVLEDDHLLDRDVAFCQVRPDNLSGTWILTSATGEFGLSVGSFRIDPRSGHVYTTQPLDYERGRFYQLAVEFHLDNVKPTIGARTEFTLSVVDVNDCAPELDTPVYLIELMENTVIGTRITRILARDRDADLKDPITYSIWPSSLPESELLSQGDETAQQRRLRLDTLARANPEVNLVRHQFTVDSEGWVILKSPLDFESTREHKLKVAAMDAVGHWNSSMVVISIIDVNDNAPHWPLKEIENNSLDHIIYADVLRHQVLQADVTVPENWLPDSSFLVYQLKLVDPDTQVALTPSFFLLPDTYTESVNELKASSYFSVSSSGAVQLRRPLDREQTAEYILKFRGSDGVFVTKDSFVLRVRVEDANDNAPICLESPVCRPFQPERILSVAEDTKRGTVLTQLVATDADADLLNSEVSYRLSSGDPSLFDINSTVGLVQLGGDLDFETKESHELSVIASDPGGLGCLFHVVVHVLDVNDNPPEFEPVAISPIPEDAPLGSLVGKVTARDRDLVDSNRLVYSLDSAHEASFTVEPHTGLLKVSRTLDRETQSVHTLTVFVTDGSSSSSIYSKSANQFTATTTFTIRLLDVNDSPPQFVNTSAHKIHVSELEPAGRHLTRLKAVSLDEGTNAVVRYRLLTKQPEFSLNETTGKSKICRLVFENLIAQLFDSTFPPLSILCISCQCLQLNKTI
ncbi:cadherin domain protein, partial [Opisthorchis viverrini]